MSKKLNTLCFIILFTAGCLPNQSEDAKNYIAKQKASSKKSAGLYKINIRKIKRYEPYQIDIDLKDPFLVKKFIEEENTVAGANDTNNPGGSRGSSNTNRKDPCEFGCPDFKRKKTFLEKYNLNAFSFVGQMKGNKNVALIKTPDVGVVQVKAGDFVGEDFGRVIDINEDALIIQEKVQSAGVWRDRKVVLEIQ